MRSLSVPAEVRRHCASVAADARWVRIDLDAGTAVGGIAGLDPEEHFLEGSREAVARYVLILDTVNFGSGWFGTLQADGAETGTATMTRRLTAHVRRRGEPWTPDELRTLASGTAAKVFGEDPRHPLMGLYDRALRRLGAYLGEGGALDAVDRAAGSASAMAASLAEMPFFEDPGYYKRAQITVNDLVLAGVAHFEDVDDLTVFADNLVPHVLRLDGVPELAGRIDAGVELPAGSVMEREVRACAVHACEGVARGLDVAPRVLDNWLWNRGLEPRYRYRPAHVTRTVAY